MTDRQRAADLDDPQRQLELDQAMTDLDQSIADREQALADVDQAALERHPAELDADQAASRSAATRRVEAALRRYSKLSTTDSTIRWFGIRTVEPDEVCSTVAAGSMAVISPRWPATATVSPTE